MRALRTDGIHPGLAAGEVVEELQFLRELLIRNLAPVMVAMRARQSMAIMLRLNRVIDKGSGRRGRLYRRARGHALAQNGVPMFDTQQDTAEVERQLSALEQELHAVVSNRGNSQPPPVLMAPADFLPALPWLAPFAALARLADTRPNLSDVVPASCELVSVIVPARDEGSHDRDGGALGPRLSLRPLELLVVDDRSTDDTAVILRRLAADDRRLRVVHGAPLPDGWYGTPWACEQGHREARVICFCSPTPIPGITRSCWGAPSRRSARKVRAS